MLRAIPWRILTIVSIFVLTTVAASRPGLRPTPAFANALTGVAAIAPGDNHTCALTTAGGVKCWGQNDAGQLGNGSTTGQPMPIPADVIDLTTPMSAIAASANYSCALTGSGHVKCWGANSDGQFGTHTVPDRSSIPVDVPGLSNVTSLSAADGYACAVTTSNETWCWGSALPVAATGRAPAPVSTLTNDIAAVSTGSAHTCVLTSAGGVKCLGDNQFGELGDGTTTQRIGAADVVGLASGVVAIGAGFDYTCALTTSGAVMCWGSGYQARPASVPGLSGITAIAVGALHTCALTGAGAIRCWGSNTSGQLGDGQQCGPHCATPVDVQGLPNNVASIAAGFLDSCAVTTTGAAFCWGENGSGQLGDGTSINRASPVAVVQSAAKATPTPTRCPAEGCPTPRSTSTPPQSPAPNFSLGIDADGDGHDDCETRSTGHGDCFLPASTSFKLKVYLDSLPAAHPRYAGFDIRIAYSGLTSLDNPDARAWPECAFPASATFPGQVGWACTIAPFASESAYTGLIGTTDFRCTQTGTVTLEHGRGSTDLIDRQSQEYFEAGPDALTVHCGPDTSQLSATPTVTSETPALAALPSTGTGSASATGSLVLAGLLACAALTLLAALGLRLTFGYRPRTRCRQAPESIPRTMASSCLLRGSRVTQNGGP